MADVAASKTLHVTYPDGQTQVFEVDQAQFDIGRSPDCDLQLPAGKVSRRHARLLLEEDKIYLVDLKSANGTMVGEQKLKPNEPYELELGESFRLGPYELTLGEPSPDTRRPAPEEPEAQDDDAEEPPEEAAEEPEPVQLGAEELPEPPEPPKPPEPPTTEPAPDPREVFGLTQAESSYLQYLPPIYGDHPFLGRFLLGFEAMWAPIEQAADHFDLYVDPDTSPSTFIEELAAWLGLTLDEKWPLETTRTLLREAGELYLWRGTRRGLSRHLEIYTGAKPEIEEPKDQGNHFRVSLELVGDRSVQRETVERIIEANKPAHTTYELNLE